MYIRFVHLSHNNFTCIHTHKSHFVDAENERENPAYMDVECTCADAEVDSDVVAAVAVAAVAIARVQ